MPRPILFHLTCLKLFKVGRAGFALLSKYITRGDHKVRGKVLLNRIAFIDFNETSYT